MEPDYFITEAGLPDILLRRRQVNDRKFGVTNVKKFQHKNKERCKNENINEREVDEGEASMSAKSIKNLQNERLKIGIEEERRRIAEREQNVERLRYDIL